VLRTPNLKILLLRPSLRRLASLRHRSCGFSPKLKPHPTTLTPHNMAADDATLTGLTSVLRLEPPETKPIDFEAVLRNVSDTTKATLRSISDARRNMTHAGLKLPPAAAIDHITHYLPCLLGVVCCYVLFVFCVCFGCPPVLLRPHHSCSCSLVVACCGSIIQKEAVDSFGDELKTNLRTCDSWSTV
jgi:hypothetical protein